MNEFIKRHIQFLTIKEYLCAMLHLQHNSNDQQHYCLFI